MDDNELLADAERYAVAGTAELSDIAKLVDKQLELQTLIDEREEELKTLKASLRKVQEDLLPDAIESAGVTEVKTRDGLKVTVKTDLTVSIPKPRKQEIIDWLKAQGESSIVKEGYEVDLNAVGDNVRKNAIAYLEDAGIPVVTSEEVNTTSLKAILRRKLQAGENLDLKFFGGYNWKKAVISQ